MYIYTYDKKTVCNILIISANKNHKIGKKDHYQEVAQNRIIVTDRKNITILLQSNTEEKHLHIFSNIVIKNMNNICFLAYSSIITTCNQKFILI